MNTDASDWYLLRDDKQFGPGDFSFLRSAVGRDGVQPSDLIWRQGMEDWVSASSIVGLITPRIPHQRTTRTALESGVVAMEPTIPPRSGNSAELDHKLKLESERAIGGCLLLVALYLLVRVAISSLNLGATIIGASEILPNSTFITIYVLATLCWMAFITVCWILNAIFFFKRKTYFPRVFIATTIIDIVGSFSKPIIAAQIIKYKIDKIDVWFFLILIAYAVVLIPYALFSRRVKYTFVR